MNRKQRRAAPSAASDALAKARALPDQPSLARRAVERALAHAPADPAILQAAAEILVELRDFDRAATVLQRLLALAPGRFDVIANLGSVLFAQGRFDQAAAAFTAALAQAPSHPLTHKNRAAAQRALGDFPAALHSYRAAIALAPGLAEAHRDLGLLLLLLGDYAAGFAAYEWRFRTATLGAPPLPGRRWAGETLPGGTILLHFEQGFGDTVQFLRYVPCVAARCARVVLCVQPPLVDLAATLAGVDAVAPAGGALPHYDCYANLLSLPHVFGTAVDSIPGQTPYLGVAADRQAQWRTALAGPGRKIGLVWAGSAEHENDRQRSLDPALLAPLLARLDTRFYSLRPGGAARQPLVDRGGAARQPLVDLGPHLTDFTTTAAILTALDLLITVDTAVAHLAGALGRPVWLLLGYVPDWRWLLGRDDSPWYPTMRLFRQPSPGDWPAVIAAVNRALDVAATQPPVRP